MTFTFPIVDPLAGVPYVLCTNAGEASVRNLGMGHAHHTMATATTTHRATSAAELPVI